MALAYSSKSAVAVARLATEICQFPVGDLGDDDAWLFVEACGVCGTDWDIYERKIGRNFGPVILGHEIVGQIAAIGKAAAVKWGVNVGTRVAVEEFLPCGVCSLCLSGDYRLCSRTDVRSNSPILRYGATSTAVKPSLWGGFSELMYLHPQSILHRVPIGLEPELATLFIPISNGIRWIAQEIQPSPGGTAVIMGPGQHGLGCVVAAKESGYRSIIVSGLSHDGARLEIASKLGATHTLASDRQDLISEVMEITDGSGADVVVDLVPGSLKPLMDAVSLIKTGGDVIIAAPKNEGGEVSYLANQLLGRSATLRGVRGHDRRSVEPALKLIASGRYPLEAMCTNVFGLDEVDTALRTSNGGQNGSIHVVVKPQA